MITFTEIALDRWRYKNAGTDQNLWQAVFNATVSTENRSFIGSICLTANQEIEIAV